MGTMATEKRRLIQLRGEIGASQTELAKEARLHQSTIHDFEQGKARIREDKAWRLYYAINRLRKARGFPEIDFEEFDWQ